MAASRLARRESPKRANAVLQRLARDQLFPARCALPWHVWEGSEIVKSGEMGYSFRGLPIDNQGVAESSC